MSTVLDPVDEIGIPDAVGEMPPRRPPDPAGPGPPEPTRLLIFYGPPLGVNGFYDIDYAVGLFSNYDEIVFGAGLEEAGHTYHASTAEIMARLPQVAFSGYLDVSTAFGNLPMATLEAKADRWAAMGARNLFLDVAGYAFGTSRARLNEIVTYAHSIGLKVAANTDEPDELFGSAVDPTWNPTGAPTALGEGDHYLLESWLYNSEAYPETDGWVTFGAAKLKAEKCLAYRAALGVKLWCSGVVDHSTRPTGAVDDVWEVQEALTLAYSLDATTLAPPDYSATGATHLDCRLYPHRPRPPVMTRPHVNGRWTIVTAPAARLRIHYEDGRHEVVEYRGA
jgi:hypothetical protein